jgi:hypothetical protein
MRNIVWAVAIAFKLARMVAGTFILRKKQLTNALYATTD